jgi:tetratricopeptide (TPR) repeat protein
MKLHLATLTSAVLLAAFAASAEAGPATQVALIRSSATLCAQAAASQSAEHMLDASRHAAIATCNDALNNYLSAADRTATLVNRGILEVGASNTDAAITDFDAALARNPQMDIAYLNRGSALMQAAKYDEARADFSRVIAMNGANTAVAYFNRGVAYEKSGNVTAAYNDYQQAQHINPSYQVASDELARFHPSDRYADNR